MITFMQAVNQLDSYGEATRAGATVRIPTAIFNEIVVAVKEKALQDTCKAWIASFSDNAPDCFSCKFLNTHACVYLGTGDLSGCPDHERRQT